VAHIWEGVIPAVTTKFNADFSIDRAWTKKNIEAQIEAGVDGIIVCGSLGEASTLSLDEKLDVLDIAVDASRGRVPVLLTIARRVVRRVTWCCRGCVICRTGARR
jgi:4-hydroxy-tetrahydrodipicolinate synthase